MFKKDEKTKSEKVLPTPATDVAAAEAAMPEERHPATKAVMARRTDPHSVPDETVRQLLASGGHAPQCPTRSMSTVPCGCGWGEPAKAAEDLLGITAERAEAKRLADEEIRARSKGA